MRSRQIYYREPVFRPPSEAYSLLIQATEGCTFRCSFCISNLGKDFLVRPLDDIKRDLDTARELYGDRVNKLFLLDGNAFVMKPDMLIAISNYAFEKFPRLERVGAYAHAKDILRKSDEDLGRIAAAGVKIAYLGIETGDDELLQKIGKQTNADELAEAAQKLHRARITLSGTIILGMAGNSPELSRRHAEATARLINRMNPPEPQTWYISALTLMTPPGTKIQDEIKKGEFKVQTSLEALEELKIIIENLSDDLHNLVWRSNHASNYLPLKGDLAQDKKKLLDTIQYGLDHPEVLRPESYRGL
jgi:radical SAM superfamily enzyme YgiQ (UPF0313 family)